MKMQVAFNAALPTFTGGECWSCQTTATFGPTSGGHGFLFGKCSSTHVIQTHVIGFHLKNGTVEVNVCQLEALEVATRAIRVRLKPGFLGTNWQIFKNTSIANIEHDCHVKQHQGTSSNKVSKPQTHENRSPNPRAKQNERQMSREDGYHPDWETN